MRQVTTLHGQCKPIRCFSFFSTLSRVYMQTGIPVYRISRGTIRENSMGGVVVCSVSSPFLKFQRNFLKNPLCVPLDAKKRGEEDSRTYSPLVPFFWKSPWKPTTKALLSGVHSWVAMGSFDRNDNLSDEDAHQLARFIKDCRIPEVITTQEQHWFSGEDALMLSLSKTRRGDPWHV